MAVRKSAAKKTAKTAARRARAQAPRTRAAKSTRRRPVSAPARPAAAIVVAEPPRPEPRTVAVLPVPMATFVF